jgi:hypothetical protein
LRGLEALEAGIKVRAQLGERVPVNYGDGAF